MLCLILAVSLTPIGNDLLGYRTAYAVGVGCGGCDPGGPTVNRDDPSGAKAVVRGPVIFEYQPSGGGDTADVYIPDWSHVTEQKFLDFNKGRIPQSYAQSDKDDMWSKIWGEPANSPEPDDGSFLWYLSIKDFPSWDACQGGQIASEPPSSSTDAACDSSATKISNAIAIYPGEFQGKTQLVYQIPASDVDSSASDLLNGKGTYFPKFYEANNHSTLGGISVGGVGANVNNNVDFFFAEGFGQRWKSLNLDRDIQVSKGTIHYVGPALFFGHAYLKTNVLSDAINSVLTSIYNAVAGLGNDLLHLVHDLITSSKNNVINQAGVVKAWGNMRFVVDILFILVLIVIAFANTLHINLEQYGIRALLPRFIIAVVGVNFSLILVQVIVDFCTVLSQAFLGNVVGFGRLFQLNLQDFPLSDTVGLIVSIILMVLALIAAVSVVAMLIARVAALWVLAALAPLAFLCLVLPVTRGLWNTWIRNVVRFALIGPLMAILILLASDFATSQGDSVSSDLLTFLIVVGLLYAAAAIPLMLGGAITAAASNLTSRGTRLARRTATPVAKFAGKKGAQGGLYAGGAASRLIAKGPGAVRGQSGLIGTGEGSRPTGKYSKLLPVGLMNTKRGSQVAGALRNTPVIGTNKRLLPTRAERKEAERQSADVEALKTRNLSNPQLNALVAGSNSRKAAAAAMVAAERGTLSSSAYSKLFDRPGISAGQKADIWSEAVKQYPPIMFDSYRRPGHPESNRLADQIKTLGPGGEGRLSSRLSDFTLYAERKSTGDLLKEMPPDIARVYNFASETDKNRVISERQFDNLSLGRQKALGENPTVTARGIIGKKSTAGFVRDSGTPPPPSGGDSTPPSDGGGPTGSGGGPAGEGPTNPGGGGSGAPPAPSTDNPGAGNPEPAPQAPSSSAPPPKATPPPMTERRQYSTGPARALNEEARLGVGVQRYSLLSDVEKEELRREVRLSGSKSLMRNMGSQITRNPNSTRLQKTVEWKSVFGTDTNFPGGLGTTPSPQYTAWNIEDGYTEGEHGEFPEPDQGGEELE